MTVARGLRIALGLNFALLLAVVGFHLRTIERTVTTMHDLSDVSTRLMLSQARQSETLALLEASVSKFAATNDGSYLVKIRQMRRVFSKELAQALGLPVSREERSALSALQQEWSQTRRNADTFLAANNASASDVHGLDGLRASLVTLRARADLVGVASRETMRRRLATAEADGERAVQVAWIAALIALGIAVVTAMALRGWITGPLQLLSTGTWEVARGRFGHRLELPGTGEFAQLARAFNVMIARLAKADRLKQEFVSNVSHDLKSPLASLRETTSLLLDQVPGPLRDSQRRVLLLQRESTERLGRMIAKLLELSRLESGIRLTRRPVAVGRLIEGAVAQGNAAGRENSVHVYAGEGECEGLRVDGDEDALRELLDNLIENAIKFSPRDGEVEVAAYAERDRVIISVADRGPGVEAEHAKLIFERFYQTAAGRAVPGRGAGLGLAICREVAYAHHGSVSVVPREGGGSVFVVNLPQARAGGVERQSGPRVMQTRGPQAQSAG